MDRQEVAVTADATVIKKALASACGEVRESDPADGAGLVAAPESAAEAGGLMRAAAEHELAVVPRGGGSRLGWGTPPSRCDLVVDLSRMSGVVEHAAGDPVARVRPGG